MCPRWYVLRSYCFVAEVTLKAALDYSSLSRLMHFWCRDTTLKNIFSVEKLNLVCWWGMKLWWGEKKFGGGSTGRLSRWERCVSFGQWGSDFINPPSRENPVVPSNSVENLKPHLAKPPPRGRWKFKVPQGLIKLPPPSSMYENTS